MTSDLTSPLPRYRTEKTIVTNGLRWKKHGVLQEEDGEEGGNVKGEP